MHNLECITHWLNTFLEQSHFPISSLWLFGSVLNSTQYHDVDIIVVFDEWDVRRFCSELAHAFYKSYKLHLHIQIFHCSQTEEIQLFLVRTNMSRRLL